MIMYDYDLKTKLIILGVCVGILIIVLIVEKIKNRKSGDSE